VSPFAELYDISGMEVHPFCTSPFAGLNSISGMEVHPFSMSLFTGLYGISSTQGIHFVRLPLLG